MMKKNELPLARWKAINGKQLQNDYQPGNPVSDPTSIEIEVKELARSMDMGSNAFIKPDDAYGMPITANLAIAMISSFQAMLKPLKSKTEKILLEFEKSNEEKYNQFFKDLNESEKHDWEKYFMNLRDLLEISSAITIDKNIILKTLSQPKCEGIRFYLCIKIIDEKPIISLVTVGVDEDGKDLHYDVQASVEASLRADNSLKTTQVENMSLISEYGSPPLMEQQM
jgi:hypothetical protein